MKYFAYGSNMSTQQMRDRCPDSLLLGKAVLRDYKIAFTIFSHKRKCGCADIVKSPGDEVWGLLYELSDPDLDKLDIAECHPDKYKRFRVNIEDEFGQIQVAETYEVVNKEGEFLRPSQNYLGLMTSAANEFNFPDGYKSFLNNVITSD